MKVFHTPTAEAGISVLRARLVGELTQQKRVLWLLSGGSNIAVADQVMQGISTELSGNLSITLTDERYGAVGHPDSNWQKLLDSGFDFKQSHQVPILTGDFPLEATREAYETTFAALLSDAEVVIGLFGMGTDGHISGILPDSPAVTITDLIAAYVTPTFTRITNTFTAIAKCDEAYLFAFGEDKKPALENLMREVPLSQEPAQILKQLAKAYVYNDQIGEPA